MIRYDIETPKHLMAIASCETSQLDQQQVNLSADVEQLGSPTLAKGDPSNFVEARQSSFVPRSPSHHPRASRQEVQSEAGDTGAVHT